MQFLGKMHKQSQNWSGVQYLLREDENSRSKFMMCVIHSLETRNALLYTRFLNLVKKEKAKTWLTSSDSKTGLSRQTTRVQRKLGWQLKRMGIHDVHAWCVSSRHFLQQIFTRYWKTLTLTCQFGICHHVQGREGSDISLDAKVWPCGFSVGSSVQGVAFGFRISKWTWGYF